MRKVKYIGNGSSIGGYKNLTVGKVYDVIKENRVGHRYDYIRINNDYDAILNYNLYDYYGLPYFEDVTTEYRNEIIDEILI